MTIKRKIEATYLLSFTFLFVGLVIIGLTFGENNYIPFVSLFSAAVSFILGPILNNASINSIRAHLFLGLIVILLIMMLVWFSDYFNEKLKKRITLFLNSIFILLFLANVALFLQGIILAKLSPAHQYTDYYSFLLVPVFAETIWKFTNKSLPRKYFIGLFYIFCLIYWLNVNNAILTMPSPASEQDWEGWAYGVSVITSFLVALFFYAVSLIIALVELAGREKLEAIKGH